ncbi:response regulator [Natronincola ferrireducens]|uniref:Stage 0 sporulation protein A homolog n=1 Tax=Natronincola ferrireducens TaxID=393762 RepID=A0A1G8XV66_9FIRM|nr:response regulator transcription factor [Natronincola ferrireducens]SDJ94366.1 DNA-binding response regulator, NarL/FixJ family, contains REC and HTH domains [Natronincola ferrireducens]
MKIVIVDDHPLVRKGLSLVLENEKNIEVKGEAGTITEACEIILKEKPDIALVDIKLGRENGLEIIEKIFKEKITCKFLLLTSSANEEDFRRAEILGAHGYVLKEALPEELLYAINLVNRGRKYYDPGLMELLMQEDDSEEILTEREQEVLKALGKGLSNREIGNRLFITEYTVKKHVSQILAKLELADRTQAALYANAKGLVKYQ